MCAPWENSGESWATYEFLSFIVTSVVEDDQNCWGSCYPYYIVQSIPELVVYSNWDSRSTASNSDLDWPPEVFLAPL